MAALVFPEWTVEDALAESKLNAHIGLFETIYYVGTTRESSTLRFCNGLSPIYSTQKCVLWKVAQIDALVGVAMAYTALVLLLVVVGSHWLRPRKVEFLLSWVWSLLFMAGVCAMVSVGAWEVLVLAFMKDHTRLGDGYSVQMGFSMLAMGAAGAVWVTLPFWRMLLHLCFVGRPARKHSDSGLPHSTAAAAVAAQQQRRKHHSASRHHHHHRSFSTARWQERTGDVLQLRRPTGDGTQVEEGEEDDGVVVMVEERSEREVLSPLESNEEETQ